MSLSEKLCKYCLKYIICISIFSFIFSSLIGCSFQDRVLPKELSLSEPEYTKEVIHFVGPGGINQSFKVFKLSPEVAQEINLNGLSFLNSMPSAINYRYELKRRSNGSTPYWMSFPKWSALPIQKDDRWKRRSYSVDVGDQPTAADFFGDVSQNYKFTNTIDARHLELFHSIIHSGKGFYAYGGYREKCVLIVSPENGLAYYLFRD